MTKAGIVLTCQFDLYNTFAAYNIHLQRYRGKNLFFKKSGFGRSPAIAVCYFVLFYRKAVCL